LPQILELLALGALLAGGLVFGDATATPPEGTSVPERILPDECDGRASELQEGRIPPIEWEKTPPAGVEILDEIPTANPTAENMVPVAYFPIMGRNYVASPPLVPTPTPTAPPLQEAELIDNGGFENGPTVWDEYSTGGFDLIVADERPHAGSWCAWLGGYEGDELGDAEDRVYQAFTVPSWARSSRLQFYLYVDSLDVDSPHDFLNGELQTEAGETLQQFSEADNTWTGSSWYLVTEDWNDFTTHAGAQRRLLFRVTNDSSLKTSFFIDDVSFVVFSAPLASDGPGAAGAMSIRTLPSHEEPAPMCRSRHNIR
jgi:hypothetical protein